MFASITFIIETIKETNKKKVYYLLAIFLSIIFTIITRINAITSSNLYLRIIIFYFITIILIGIYLNYKNTKKSFSKYLISSFSNLLELGIIYIVLNIGGLLIIYLIDALIINGILSNGFDKMLVLLFGSFFVPAILYSISTYKEVNKFINTLVTKILFTLVLIAYIVVYIYIIKILVTLKVPSNTIFPLLLVLFIISTIINIMGIDSEKDKRLLKFHKILPYLYIPFIFLECYSLGVRISIYGLTITRYLGIIAIIFEIIYTVFYILKKDTGLLIYVIIAELFIALIIPFINCYDLPINTQYQHLVEYKNTKKVTSETRGAYNYLINYDKGRKLIDNLLTKQEKNILMEYPNDDDNYYYYQEVKNIDIKGYQKLEKNYENNDNKLKYKIIIDKIKSCRNGNKEDCFETNNIIIIDNHKLIIQLADYTTNNETYSLEYYDLTK